MFRVTERARRIVYAGVSGSGLDVGIESIASRESVFHRTRGSLEPFRLPRRVRTRISIKSREPGLFDTGSFVTENAHVIESLCFRTREKEFKTQFFLFTTNIFRIYVYVYEAKRVKALGDKKKKKHGSQ